MYQQWKELKEMTAFSIGNLDRDTLPDILYAMIQKIIDLEKRIEHFKNELGPKLM